MAFRAAEAEARRAAFTHKLVGGILVVIAAVGIVIFKYGMRSQMREDLAVGAGYKSYAEYEAERDKVYPSDSFSYEFHRLADDMCRCRDLACARNTQADVRRHMRTGSPSDDMAEASVRQDSERLGDCMARIESGETPAP